VEWSPFEPNRLACAAAQHFGIVGNGRQYVLELTRDGMIRAVGMFDTRDGLYDCSWSEQHDRHLISGSGDGSIKVRLCWSHTGTRVRTLADGLAAALGRVGAAWATDSFVRGAQEGGVLGRLESREQGDLCLGVLGRLRETVVARAAPFHQHLARASVLYIQHGLESYARRHVRVGQRRFDREAVGRQGYSARLSLLLLALADCIDWVQNRGR
jgi:hypothetical protein